ncbi:hypothetical protein WJX74_003463 [Apatococcus lobatus]|uniref:Uncharacterized protein n=1 Tax=Apatococcus lobatus TaxID=904363 RepID=A0AAW1QJT5_9CHLO
MRQRPRETTQFPAWISESSTLQGAAGHDGDWASDLQQLQETGLNRLGAFIGLNTHDQMLAQNQAGPRPPIWPWPEPSAELHNTVPVKFASSQQIIAPAADTGAFHDTTVALQAFHGGHFKLAPPSHGTAQPPAGTICRTRSHLSCFCRRLSKQHLARPDSQQLARNLGLFGEQAGAERSLPRPQSSQAQPQNCKRRRVMPGQTDNHCWHADDFYHSRTRSC